MKVSLRKANALQEALAEAVKSSTKTQREVDVLNTVMWKPEINNVQTRYFDEIRGKLDMVNVRFTIRQLVSTANAECGVSDLLTEFGILLTQQSLPFKGSSFNNLAREKDEILEKKRERKLARVDNPEYDGYMEMEVSVISKEDRDHWEDKVKELRRKASINDQLLELNIRTDIELPTFVEEVLRKENLI